MAPIERNTNTDLASSVSRLIALLQTEERENLIRACGLGDDASKEDIVESVCELPRYELVRLFVLAAGATLTMLREIFLALESFGIRVRTTGCVFMLSDPTIRERRAELEFSQQSVNVISEWGLLDTSKLSEPIKDLRSRWSRFRSVWRNLLSKAEPYVTRGRLDVVQSVIRGRETYGQDRDHTDEKAQKVLTYLLEKARVLVEKFEAIPSSSRGNDVDWLISDARQLLAAGERCLQPSRYQTRRRSAITADRPPTENDIRRCTSYQFPTEFDRFLEDALLLGDLIESGQSLSDILRLDVWSSRPQVFEIWVLMKVLCWLSQRSHRIKLLQTTASEGGGPFRWDLSYARSTKACAVVRTPDSDSLYLFYQLYRSTGDMPDIALLSGDRTSNEAIWSIDPKHSEKGGYSASDYRRTAKRYRHSFGARFSFVVEYYDRSDLGLENPMAYGDNTFFVHACRPGGSGLDRLFAELEAVHPVAGGALVCIDFSSSFEAQRITSLKTLRKRILVQRERCSDVFICFAGEAESRLHFQQWLEHEEEVFLDIDVEDGTRIEPLANVVRDVTTKHYVTKILLVTDGKFDRPLPEVIEMLSADSGLDVEVYQ